MSSRVRIGIAFAVTGLSFALMGATYSSVTAKSTGFASEKLEVEHLNRENPVVQQIEPANPAADAATPEDAGVKISVSPAAAGPEPAASAPEPKHFYEEELVDVLRSVGFEGESLRHAWAVAMKESTGNPNAHNQNASTGDNSYGLFQINMIGRLGPARLEKFNLDSYEDLFDPYTNASIAFEMSKGGTDWGQWGIGPNAYNGGTTGSYYKWLDEFRRVTNG